MKHAGMLILAILTLLAADAQSQQALTINTTSLPAATVGVSYSQTLDAKGGRKPYAWSISAGALPAGITLDPVTGIISGTATVAGTSNFSVRVTDAANATATQTLQLAVQVPPLAITTSSLPSGTVGVAYSQTLAATGGTGGYTWSVASGSLPGGLSLSASGSITGTPTAAGTSNFTAQVKDSSGVTANQALSVTIAPPALTVTTTSLPAGTVGVAYSQTLAASGGTGGYTWSVASGSLPGGLSLSASGAITGTPTAAGTTNFTVQVKDSSGTTASRALSITINPPALSVTTTSLPNGTVGVAYSQTLAASGGAGGNTWSVTSGSLPAGLTLSASGAITGTPTAAGTNAFTVQVKDSAGNTANGSLSIAVNPPALIITTTALPGGTAGSPYSATLSATGGTGGYTWSVTAGSLPAGLSLSSAGAITGTPTSAATSSFTVQAQDSSGVRATANLSIAVAVPLTITTSSLPGAVVSSPYSQTLSATGGSGGYVWSLAAGSLPSGLALSSSGALAGTPQTAGAFSFTVKVTDSASVGATRALTLTVVAPVTVNVPALPAGEVGLSYSASISASGGSGSYTWSVAAGQLPPGLTLVSSTGALSGSPATAGSFGFTVRATDANGLSGTATASIEVRPEVTITTDPTLAGASAGSSYTQTLTANGGFPPYSWALISGGLPIGLTLNTSGTLSGTPTQVGAFQFTVQARDAVGGTAQSAFSLTVASGLTIATAPVLPTGTNGVRYSLTLQPAGGVPPYVWAITSGSLPAGLNFSAAGVLDGTPTASGTFTFTAQVTDGNTNKASKQFTLAVTGALTITTAPALPGGVGGAPYSQTLAAAGGTPPYLWTVTGGSLPPGLTLEGPTGVLSGTPSAAGSFDFTVTVTDSASIAAQRHFTIEIGQGVTITTPASLPDATAGAAYSFTLGAAGGQAPYSWSITQGSLPAGLALNGSSGIISGTPTLQGTNNFTTQVTDAAARTASRVQTIVVRLPSSSPSMTISGIGSTVPALQQPVIDIALASAYPVTISGRLNVSFAPGGSNPVDDPSIQFSTGGRSAAFTIPANTTHAVFTSQQFALQVGSVAGTLTLTIDSLQANNTPLASPAPVQVQVAAAAPQIRSVTVVRQSGGFQVRVLAVSSTRDLTQATVNFHPSAGSNVQTTTATVQLGDVSNTWFRSAASASYGGQFTLTLPFTFTGTAGGLDSVSVVLSNAAGASQETSGAY